MTSCQHILPYLFSIGIHNRNTWQQRLYKQDFEATANRRLQSFCTSSDDKSDKKRAAIMAAKHILTDRSTCRKTYDGRDTVEMRQGCVSSAPDNEPDQKIRQSQHAHTTFCKVSKDARRCRLLPRKQTDRLTMLRAREIIKRLYRLHPVSIMLHVIQIVDQGLWIA